MWSHDQHTTTQVPARTHTLVHFSAVVPVDNSHIHTHLIGKKLDAQFDNEFSNLPTVVIDDNKHVFPLDEFNMISIEQLNSEIKNIAIHKSSGIHNRSSYVMKMCFMIFNEKLLVIMNKSLFQGYFPDEVEMRNGNAYT